jgi:hypothetical protein
VLRFFFEAHDSVIQVDFRHAEAFGLFGRRLGGGDRYISLVLAMPVDHRPVIHFVDVIAREDQHQVSAFGENAVRVLKYGIGCPHVPAFTCLFHGRNELNEFAQLRRKNAPSVAHMADQFERFVLRKNENAADV